MKRHLVPIKNLLLAATLLTFTGCASVFNSGPEQIQIDSTPNGARVTIYDERGEIAAQGRTQLKTQLKAGGKFERHSYRVKIEKLGYAPKELLIRNELSGWYWGNFIYSGPLGALVVDPLTGNMWKLDPVKLDVTLEKLALPDPDLSTVGNATPAHAP
jgi:hypothetical protein